MRPRRNLREQGFEWDEVILAPPGAQFPSAADFKAPERKKIVERGYTDSASRWETSRADLTGGFAERTFRAAEPRIFSFRRGRAA